MTPYYPISRPNLSEIELEYVLAAVRSGWISSLGEYIDRFENRFASFCGTRHAISVSNGTTALHLALKALEIGEGDEVIVPDLSFVATANAVIMSGAKPVFADIDAETLCLNPDQIAKCLSSRTKAIIPVHLYGHPADMEAINELARAKDLAVIEDAAEAHGAMIGEEKVGSFGNCAIFSFYGNKNLTTGEGGMITTNDDRINERCRKLRDHAMSKDKRYWHEELGYNYRMTNMQAAIGCAQLERAHELLSGRQAVFNLYRERLGGVETLRLNRTADRARNSYWLVCVEIKGLSEQSRDELALNLKDRGVDTRPYFYPMSDMPHLPEANTPVAHAIARKGMNLPTYIGLQERDVDYICDQLLDCLKMVPMNA